MKNIKSVIISSILVIAACLFLTSCSVNKSGRYRIISGGEETILEQYRFCRSSQNYGKLVVNCWLPDTSSNFDPDFSVVVDRFEKLPEEE